MDDKRGTVWQEIYKKLKDSGIVVYSPGQYEGECRSPYVVVTNSGSSSTTEYSTSIVYYSVMCYVPLDSYSMLERFVTEVKEVMKEMFPLVRADGVETPATLDEELKAHMISVEYMNYRKMNYL